MITLKKCGQAAAGGINSRFSDVDPGLDGTPLVCYSGMPPPPQRVYKEVGDSQFLSVLSQEENSSSGKLCQEITNASTGRSLAEENTLLEVSYDPRASLSPWSQPFSCIGHHSPPSASLEVP